MKICVHILGKESEPDVGIAAKSKHVLLISHI